MIQRIFFILSIAVFWVVTARAQDSGLFIPHEVQKAYEKGTRSFSGAPGEHYFQDRKSVV